MEASSQPTPIITPFGVGAVNINVIPIPPNSDPTLASFTTGFTPETMTPLASGGTPANGADMNGVWLQHSEPLQWLTGGGPVTYNADWSTTNGGYPEGAVLVKATLDGWWVSQVDNNTTDPDTGGANWLGLTFTGLLENMFPLDGIVTLAYSSASQVVKGDITYQLTGTVVSSAGFGQATVSEYFNPVLAANTASGSQTIFAQSTAIFGANSGVDGHTSLAVNTGAPGTSPTLITGALGATRIAYNGTAVCALVQASSIYGGDSYTATSAAGPYTGHALPAHVGGITHWNDIAASGSTFIITQGSPSYEDGISTGSATGYHSTDGATWTSMTLPSAKNWQRLAFGNSKFVAAGGDGGTGAGFGIAYSSDGASWTAATTPRDGAAVGILSLQYVGALFFCRLSDNTYITSSDGVSWTNRGTWPVPLADVPTSLCEPSGNPIYPDDIGWTGTYYTANGYAFSADGHAWTLNPVQTASQSVGAVVFNGTAGYASYGGALNFSPIGYVGYPINIPVTNPGVINGTFSANNYIRIG